MGACVNHFGFSMIKWQFRYVDPVNSLQWAALLLYAIQRDVCRSLAKRSFYPLVGSREVCIYPFLIQYAEMEQRMHPRYGEFTGGSVREKRHPALRTQTPFPKNVNGDQESESWGVDLEMTERLSRVLVRETCALWLRITRWSVRRLGNLAFPIFGAVREERSV